MKDYGIIWQGRKEIQKCRLELLSGSPQCAGAK
jgi:hypothetical protein